MENPSLSASCDQLDALFVSLKDSIAEADWEKAAKIDRQIGEGLHRIFDDVSLRSGITPPIYTRLRELAEAYQLLTDALSSDRDKLKGKVLSSRKNTKAVSSYISNS